MQNKWIRIMLRRLEASVLQQVCNSPRLPGKGGGGGMEDTVATVGTAFGTTPPSLRVLFSFSNLSTCIMHSDENGRLSRVLLITGCMYARTSYLYRKVLKPFLPVQHAFQVFISERIVIFRMCHNLMHHLFYTFPLLFPC